MYVVPCLSCIFFVLILIGSAESECNSGSECKSHMKRLKEDLFRDYDTSVRPVRLHSDRTTVIIEMIPLALVLEEDYDQFVLDASMHFTWKDEFLVWNPSEYGGINLIRLNDVSVWVPEVFQLSSWDITDLRQGYTLCNLFSSGWLHCWNHYSLPSLCHLDLTHWPYDSQNCSVTISTVTQSEEEIELLVVDDAVDLNEYNPTHTWKLFAVGYTKYNHVFGNKVFPCVQYNFLLRRNEIITEVSVVVPITVFVFLLLASFWLNADEEVRLNLCYTLIVCHVLLLQDIGHITNGDNVPVIGLFFRDSFALCVLSLELTVFMQWLNAIPATTVPDLIISVMESKPARILLLSARRNCPKVSEPLNDAKQESGDSETQSDVMANWRLFGTLLNRLSFLVVCVIYLVLIFMYVV
ncbi:Neuronal acetylcholine receptor subunit alpha-5 [Zootermopsis nevadensis]|uniref:Neuronal acetylcholine receptor subunit alpha-5 n=1 Tax=Zootermopsis nevadensis TaxID=136037 RepID=A0A067RCS7_ZOONE|nr:Neuronal acetylcholine receptor subunit alpha-5 [Zootermopsis nevadensis]